MKNSTYGNFIDILYYLPKKIVFTDKTFLIDTLHATALEFKFKTLLPDASDYKAFVKQIDANLKELNSYLKLSKGQNNFTIDQSDEFRLLASASMGNKSSGHLNKIKEISRRLLVACESYSDKVPVIVEKTSEKVLKLAKKYQDADTQVYGYLVQYAEVLKERERIEK